MADNDPWAEFRSAPADPWGDFRIATPSAESHSVGQAEDIIRSLGGGAEKGVANLVGAPGDLQAVAKSYNPFDWLAQKFAERFPETAASNRALAEKVGRLSDIGEIRLPSSTQIEKGIESAAGPIYAPQTTGGRYAETVGEFLPAALTGPEGVVSNVVKGAVVPSVASEFAGSNEMVAGTPWETPARVAGAVIGGVGAHGGQTAVNLAKSYGQARGAAQEAGDLLGTPDITPRSMQLMAKAAKDDELTPALAAAQARALGPEAMMMDMGRQVLGRAEDIAAQPGVGQNRVLNAVEGRTGALRFDPAQGRYVPAGAAAGGRIAATLDQSMGQSPDVVALRNRIGDFVDQHAGPAYDQVMAAHPAVDVPTSITRRPAIQSAMGNAVKLARNYGEELESPTETQTILRGPGYHIAEDVSAPAQTSLRYWDYVKKDLDRRINSYMKSGGTSELGSADKADLGGLISARNALRNHLDTITNGDYAGARRWAANKPQLTEALEFGQSALNTKLLPEELAEHLSEMSVPQRAMAQAGMRREIARIMDVASNDGAAARRLLDTNQNLEKISDTFGQPAARTIEDRIAAETKFQQATNQVSGSARTALRQALRKDTESPSIAAPPVANVLGYASKGLNAAWRNIRELSTEKTRNAIGTLTTAPAAKIPDLARILTEYNQSLAARPPVVPYASALARTLALNAPQRSGP